MKVLKNIFVNGSHSWLGYSCAIGAAIAYGASQTIGKHVTTNYAPPLTATAFSLFFGFIYVSLMFHRHIAIDMPTSNKAGIFWFATSGIASASGVTLMYFAINSAPLVVVSPVFAVSPLITLTLAHIFLRKLENITRKTLAGTSLVVLGIIIITLSRTL